MKIKDISKQKSLSFEEFSNKNEDFIRKEL